MNGMFGIDATLSRLMNLLNADLDDGNPFGISEARDLHVQQAELATMAFLERNPKDFDNPDLLKLTFLKPALAKAQDERVKEMAEFRASAVAPESRDCPH